MKNLRHASLALASLLCLTAPVHAQDRARPEASRPEAVAGTQVLTFGDELVQSQLTRPEDATCRGLRPAPRISLIHMRQNFVPEMAKSVENL